jgi:hypothetical protein
MTDVMLNLQGQEIQLNFGGFWAIHSRSALINGSFGFGVALHAGGGVANSGVLYGIGGYTVLSAGHASL